MAKLRRYEFYGYDDNQGFIGKTTQIAARRAEEDAINERQDGSIKDLEKNSIEKVVYNDKDKVLEFINKDGKVVSRVPIQDIIGNSLVEDSYYDKDKKAIVIDFGKNSKGEEVTVEISVADLLDVTEFSSGLTVSDSGVVSVLIDPASEPVVIDDSGATGNVLTVSENGINAGNVQKAIDVEKDRALAAEAYLQEEINNITSGGSIEDLKRRVEALEDYVNKLQQIIRLKEDTGELLLNIEDDWLSANDLLAQLAHETFDTSGISTSNDSGTF